MVSRNLLGAMRDVFLKGGSLAIERSTRLLLLVVAAHTLGEVTFGRFVFASTATAMLVLGTDLGLGAWTIRSLARDDDGSDVMRAGLALRMRAVVPYVVAVIAVAIFTRENETRIAILCLGVSALANTFFDHFAAIHRGHERFAEEARLHTWRAFLSTTLSLCAVAIGRSLTSLSASLAVAAMVCCALGAFTLRRFHPHALTLSLLVESLLDGARAREVFRGAFPIWLGTLLSMMYFKVDTIFLKAMTSDAELGAYGAAYKLFEAANNLPSVILAVAFPKLARVYNDRKAQRQLEQRLAMLLLGLGIMVGLGCFATSEWLIRILFGEGFERAVPSLRLLALAIPILYLNFGLTHFLLARNLARFTSFFAFLLLVLNVVLNVTLIPVALGPGAALSTVITEVALTVCCFFALRLDSKRAS